MLQSHKGREHVAAADAAPRRSALGHDAADPRVGARQMSKQTLRIFDMLAGTHKRQLRKQFARRNQEMGQCTQSMRDTISMLDARGWTTHRAVWNACLFINVVSHDLSLIVYDLTYERDQWKRNSHARALALLLYEIAEDIPAVLGKEFQRAMRTLDVPQEMQAALRKASKRNSEFWNDHRSLLKEIRTTAAAHRDHDAMKMLDVIDGIDLFTLHGLGLGLGNVLLELGAAAQPILTFTANKQPPEMNMEERGPNKTGGR
jgi:hypothetical protein